MGCKSASGFDPSSTQTNSTNSASAWITPSTRWAMLEASAVKNLVSKRRTRDQKQAGRVGQEAGIGERLPGALQRRRHAVALAAEAKAGFLAGLADRGDRQRTRPRGCDLRTALEQVL